jgi:hypothetical protein
VLFVWKNAFSLAPPIEASADPEPEESDRDAGGGLADLVERNIGRDRIIRACHDAWKSAIAEERKPDAETLRRIDACIEADQALPPRRRDPAAGYERIALLLDRSRRGVRIPDGKGPS